MGNTAMPKRGPVDGHSMSRDPFEPLSYCKAVDHLRVGYRRGLLVPFIGSGINAPTLQRSPEQRSPRVQRDEALMPEIERVWQANLQVYDANEVWRQLNREGVAVARCTVERLTPSGIAGCCARQARAHHDQRQQGKLPAGSGQSAVQGRSSQPVVGVGFHLCFDLARLDLCGLRH